MALLDEEKARQEAEQPTDAVEQERDLITEASEPVNTFMGDMLAADAANVERQRAALAEKQQALAAARANRRSVMAAALGELKPRRDIKNERDMRRAAMVMSLGNLVGAAFGLGMGTKGHYAPPIDTQGPMAPISELNRIQQDYFRRKEQFDNLNFSLKQREADDDLAAIQADYSAASKDLSAAQSRYQESLRHDADKKLDVYLQLLKEGKEAQAREAERQWEEARMRLKYNLEGGLARSKASSRGYGSGSRRQQTADAAALQIGYFVRDLRKSDPMRAKELFGDYEGIPRDSKGKRVSKKVGGFGDEATETTTEDAFSWKEQDDAQRKIFTDGAKQAYFGLVRSRAEDISVRYPLLSTPEVAERAIMEVNRIVGLDVNFDPYTYFVYDYNDLDSQRGGYE